MRTRPLVLAGLVLTSVAFCAGEDSVGFVRGMIIDAVSGEPVSGSQGVRAGVFGSVREADGRYTIKARPGTYEMVASAPMYADRRLTVRVLAGDTVIVDFRLQPNQCIYDSIMASFAKIRVRDLRRIERRRNPSDIARNNSIKLAAWRTYQSAKGTYGIKKTMVTVEGDPIYIYLLVEYGTCRTVVDDRKDKFGGREVRETGIPRFVLSEGRRLAADSIHQIAIPFSGSMSKDKELRFEFPDDSGYVDGHIPF